MNTYKLKIHIEPFSYDKRGMQFTDIVNHIKSIWNDKYGDAILPAPIYAYFHFVFARRNKSPEVYYHTSKPDLDNITKGIINALIGVAYVDDRHVVRYIAEKHYGNNDMIIVKLTTKK